jgi:hypothetical protein
MIADTQDRFLGNRVAAPAERLKAREELEERQGPDQIVVAAGPLATDFVVDFSEPAKYQEGRGDAAIAQLADHRNAIDVEKHAVNRDHGTIVCRAMARRFVAASPCLT